MDPAGFIVGVIATGELLMKRFLPVIFTLIGLSAVYADDMQALDEVRHVANEMPVKLMAVLQAELAQGGFSSAIAACREKAPQMAKAASERTGWSIRRVSLQNRNPNAVPDPWERLVLLDFERRAKAGEDLASMETYAVIDTEGEGQPMLRYMKALPTQPLCLNCHGPREQMAPAVLEQLDALYPEDRATGYRVGDIRGAITIKRPL